VARHGRHIQRIWALMRKWSGDGAGMVSAGLYFKWAGSTYGWFCSYDCGVEGRKTAEDLAT